MRREAFDRVSGFDEGYFMFFEDVDLGWRISDAGYRNYYVPKASAIHLGGHSTKSNYDLMLQATTTTAQCGLSASAIRVPCCARCVP